MNVDAGSNEMKILDRIPVSGRARSLLFGPYKTLSNGKWVAHFTFELDKWSYIYTYRAEFGSGQQYSQTMIKVPAPGRYRFSLSYNVESDLPCEFRLILTEGALQGELKFVSLDLVRE